jgi:SSS family solute:Na+ symporter
MHILDWLIICIPLGIVFFISWYTRRYMKSVADFLAASRSAGRYLVATSVGTARYGAITAVMTFEMMRQSGVTMVSWWWTITVSATLFIALTGFVVYRYRETRAMTLAQFFEARYNRRFRILAGFLCFFSGALNYGVFPGVAARFFVFYLGMPQTILIGGFVLPTFALVMVLLLGLALYLSLMGGQLTVMVNDAVEGLISGVFYLVVAFALLHMFDWSQIFQGLSAGAQNLHVSDIKAMFTPPPGSMGNWLVDPLDSPGATKDFNIYYVLMSVLLLTYATMAWQGNQAFNCSAANPHEAKMGNILGNWREFARSVMIILLGLCAISVLRTPGFSHISSQVVGDLKPITNSTIQEQMLIPTTLGYLLPLGIKGCFAAIMLFAMLACDGSYLHSWGAIFIQDVVMPFRRKPLSAKQHITLLRWAMIGVGVFAFFFSTYYKPADAIRLFFDITGAIFLGGAGAAIIGGLYWKRGTTYGATAAFVVAATISITGIIIKQKVAGFAEGTPDRGYWEAYLTIPFTKHILNGQEVNFIATLLAVATYIVLSLLTCRQPHNMDRLLHRGQYAVKDDTVADVEPAVERSIAARLLGWDRHFTLGDKWVSGTLFGWTALSLLLFVGITSWNIWGKRWPLSYWSTYWWVYIIILPLIIGVITTVWFTWGVLRDLRRLFHTLNQARRDERDDGTVKGDHMLADEPMNNSH